MSPRYKGPIGAEGRGCSFGAGEGQAERLVPQMIKPLTRQNCSWWSTDADFLCPLCRAVAVLSPTSQGGREKKPFGAGPRWGWRDRGAPGFPALPTLCSLQLSSHGEGGQAAHPPGEEDRQPASAAGVSCSSPPLCPRSLFVSSDRNQELLHRFLGLPTDELCIGLLGRGRYSRAAATPAIARSLAGCPKPRRGVHGGLQIF